MKDESARVLWVETMTARHALKERKKLLREVQFEKKCLEKAVNTQRFSKSQKKKFLKDKRLLEKRLSKLSFKENKGESMVRFKNRIAFIVLSDKLTRDKILRAYSEDINRGFWICKLFKPRPKFRLRPAPEPGLIVWKNIRYTLFSRRMVYFFQILVSMIMTVILLFVVSNLVQLVGLFVSGSSDKTRFEYGKIWSFMIYVSIELTYSVGKVINDKIFRYSRFLSQEISSWNRAFSMGFLKYGALLTLSQIYQDPGKDQSS